jgi:hypothetical protein
MPSDRHHGRGRSAIVNWRVKAGKREVFSAEKRGACETFIRERGGERAAWVQLLKQAARALGDDVEQVKLAELVAEREQAVAALREVCKEFGDNDWPDNLHLSDVIEKHLAQPLLDREEERLGDAREQAEMQDMCDND